MAIISDKDQEFLRKHFEENITSNVEIIMFTERPSPIIVPGKQECETCEQTEALLKEVAALSDKIDLKVLEIATAAEEAAAYGIDRVPAFVLKGAARGQVRFFGIPIGYEFSAFIEDLVDTAAGATDLSEETRSFLASLAEPVNIKVFTTPT
ncbi:MAG TPA: thioredoxin family protein [Blastocatellia bacterium]|nr:thioredoxin family protein [Blastocatellia bacterium]